MIRIDAIWLATEPMDMCAGTETALARVVAVFGAAQPHCASALDQRELAVAGGDHLENQLSPKRIVGAANGGACGFIGAVEHAGSNAGAALHSDFMPLADQLLDGFRGCSNPCCTRLVFERNTNVHVNIHIY